MVVYSFPILFWDLCFHISFAYFPRDTLEFFLYDLKMYALISARTRKWPIKIIIRYRKVFNKHNRKYLMMSRINFWNFLLIKGKTQKSLKWENSFRYEKWFLLMNNRSLTQDRYLKRERVKGIFWVKLHKSKSKRNLFEG